jgi:hypothetical protein
VAGVQARPRRAGKTATKRRKRYEEDDDEWCADEDGSSGSESDTVSDGLGEREEKKKPGDVESAGEESDEEGDTKKSDGDDGGDSKEMKRVESPVQCASCESAFPRSEDDGIRGAQKRDTIVSADLVAYLPMQVVTRYHKRAKTFPSQRSIPIEVRRAKHTAVKVPPHARARSADDVYKKKNARTHM